MVDIKTRSEEITEVLREKGYKITPQRLAIVNVLAESERHPNVGEIFDELQKDFPTLSLATVYRNVMLIKSLGQAFEIGLANDKNRYDGNKPYPHPHVICVKCKKVIDGDSTDSESASERVARETGFRIINECYYGICPECWGER
jgi:Fur family peroxide stress response transcriptional regulator